MASKDEVIRKIGEDLIRRVFCEFMTMFSEFNDDIMLPLKTADDLFLYQRYFNYELTLI